MRWILTTLLLTTFFISPLSAQELTGTLQKIKESGKIKVGYRQDKPPMSFATGEGTPEGYSIDICNMIVAAAQDVIGSDVSIEYVPVDAKERFDALADNKIDILCGATTKTLSRSEIVDFTQLTFVTGASFMALKETKIRNNFDGKKVGVINATTTADELKKLLKETQTKTDIVLLNSSEEALDGLKKGKIDAFAADQIVLIGMALTSGAPKNFTVLPDLFSFEPFALAVRRNDADFRLVADRVISNLYRSRQILKIYDKWLGQFSVNRPSAFEALIMLNAIPE